MRYYFYINVFLLPVEELFLIGVLLFTLLINWQLRLDVKNFHAWQSRLLSHKVEQLIYESIDLTVRTIEPIRSAFEMYILLARNEDDCIIIIMHVTMKSKIGFFNNKLIIFFKYFLLLFLLLSNCIRSLFRILLSNIWLV